MGFGSINISWSKGTTKKRSIDLLRTLFCVVFMGKAVKGWFMVVSAGLIWRYGRGTLFLKIGTRLIRVKGGFSMWTADSLLIGAIPAELKRQHGLTGFCLKGRKG